MIDLRLIPSRIEAVCGGVTISPSRTRIDVLARALADVPRLVEQDRLVVAGVRRLGLGEDRVQVLAGCLGLRDQPVRRDPPPRGDLGAHARCACPPRRDRRPRARPRRSRRPARTARRAPSRRTRGTRAGGCSSSGSPLRRISSCVASRISSTECAERQVVHLRRPREALEVLAMAEDRGPAIGLVAADALEDARCRSAARARGRGPWRRPRRRTRRSSRSTPTSPPFPPGRRRRESKYA